MINRGVKNTRNKWYFSLTISVSVLEKKKFSKVDIRPQKHAHTSSKSEEEVKSAPDSAVEINSVTLRSVRKALPTGGSFLASYLRLVCKGAQKTGGGGGGGGGPISGVSHVGFHQNSHCWSAARRWKRGYHKFLRQLNATRGAVCLHCCREKNIQDAWKQNKPHTCISCFIVMYL